jgi:hypothetical protein
VSPQFKLAIVAAGCCDVVVQALNAHHEDKCAATLGLEMISSMTGGPGLGESRSDHQHKLRKAGIVFYLQYRECCLQYWDPNDLSIFSNDHDQGQRRHWF